jgi:hypothetical protein
VLLVVAGVCCCLAGTKKENSRDLGHQQALKVSNVRFSAKFRFGAGVLWLRPSNAGSVSMYLNCEHALGG